MTALSQNGTDTPARVWLPVGSCSTVWGQCAGVFQVFRVKHAAADGETTGKVKFVATEYKILSLFHASCPVRSVPITLPSSFTKTYLAVSLLFPEGRAGIAWEHLKQ